MESNTRVIIHVSGSPGSGKTTLGEHVQELFKNNNCIVKDLDDFTDDISKDTANVFFEVVHDRTEKFKKQHSTKHIVFVGILDIIINDEIYVYEFDDKKTHLFYLDPPLPVLLKQFYTRIITIGERDPLFWEEIAEKKFAIPPSDYKIDEALKTKAKHQKIGYAAGDWDFVMESVSKLLRQACFLCSEIPTGSCSNCLKLFCHGEKCFKNHKCQ